MRPVTRFILRKFVRPIPIIGEAAILLTAADVLKRKGVFGGSLDIALDSIPLVGTAKGVIEFATGDLIPDKRSPGRSGTKALTSGAQPQPAERKAA